MQCACFISSRGGFFFIVSDIDDVMTATASRLRSLSVLDLVLLTRCNIVLGTDLLAFQYTGNSADPFMAKEALVGSHLLESQWLLSVYR